MKIVLALTLNFLFVSSGFAREERAILSETAQARREVQSETQSDKESKIAHDKKCQEKDAKKRPVDCDSQNEDRD